jgi:HK97 family phage prohead protease
MHNFEIFVAAAELKFAGNEQSGEFEGYGSVYDILDSHKDVIVKGAFDASLAEHATKGTMPGLYVEHSAYTGGDPLPVGVYTEMKSDEHGLKVKGKISALDTDYGRRVYGLMRDGALKGMSIAYAVPPGGARMGKKQGEPRRTLTAINLHSVDIVRDPSNSAARIQELKTAFARHLKDAGGPGDPGDLDEDTFEGPDIEDAIESLAAAIIAQDRIMCGNSGCSPYAYSGVKDAALLMDSLRDAYEALTGERVPDGLIGWTKAAPITLRAIRTTLVDELGLSRKRADDIAKLLFGSLPRDEGSTRAPAADTKSALDEMGAAVDGLSSLPKF